MVVRKKPPEDQAATERRMDAWTESSIDAARRRGMVMVSKRMLELLDKLNDEVYLYLKLNGLHVPDHIARRHFDMNQLVDDDIPF